MKTIRKDRRDFLKASALGTTSLGLFGNLPTFAAAVTQQRQTTFATSSPSSPATVAATPANGKLDLRFRQIHLDFHTSEKIEDVGAQFDAEEFVATLERARVDSITCFARCHHGYIYYDTKAHPERRHPHLKKNLLQEQIEACHRKNIRVPIYTTIQWDQFTADAHPEWRMVTDKGALQGTPPYEAGFYRQLCLNSPYVDFLKAHIKDIFDTVPVDGLFLDIVKLQDCSCAYCRRGMIAKNIDPADAAARLRYGAEVTDNFQRDMSAYIRGFNKQSSIFYNGGHIGTDTKRVADTYSHFELESLPSGGWGYIHFPLTIRYARNLGADSLGMTGKFHTSWGDFHSYKNKEALQFECFQMLALGAKCSIGDQLHPSGKMDAATYDLVASVYADVEKKEPWCRAARPLTDIAIYSPEEFIGGRTPPPALGAIRLLQEGAHQFDLIDSKTDDLARYKVLILPDDIAVSTDLAGKLAAYVRAGGALIASHKSGLGADGKEFALGALGVKLKGEAEYSPDYLIPKGAIGSGLPQTEHAMYLKALHVEPAAGAEVLCDTAASYFNRTWEHYSSHRQTPSSGKIVYPGVVRNGRAIYFAHPIFTQYGRNAPRWCKKLVLNALGMLLPEPLVRVEAPTTTIATLNEQAAEKRWALHLLSYIPERRGQDFDIIEDVIPLFDIKTSVRVPARQRVRSVAVVPQGVNLTFKQKGERVEFTLPKLEGHQIIALNFA